MSEQFVKYKMFIWIVVILIILNMLILGLLWFGGPGKQPKHPPPPEHVGGFFKNELGWNDEQKEKFDLIRNKYFKESKILFDSLKDFRKELFETIFKETDGNVKADSLSQRIGELQTKIDLQRYYHFKEIENICNDAGQKKKFENLLLEVFLPGTGPENMRPPPPR